MTSVTPHGKAALDTQAAPARPRLGRNRAGAFAQTMPRGANRELITLCVRRLGSSKEASDVRATLVMNQTCRMASASTATASVPFHTLMRQAVDSAAAGRRAATRTRV